MVLSYNLPSQDPFDPKRHHPRMCSKEKFYQGTWENGEQFQDARKEDDP